LRGDLLNGGITAPDHSGETGRQCADLLDRAEATVNKLESGRNRSIRTISAFDGSSSAQCDERQRPGDGHPGWKLLVDPESGQTSSDQVILVEGRTIRAVGADVAIPAGARVIDLIDDGLAGADRLSYPRLLGVAESGMDCRARLREADSLHMTLEIRLPTGRTQESPMHGRCWIPALPPFATLAMPATTLHVDLRRAITEGLVPGPTMITAGRIIAPIWRPVCSEQIAAMQ
jgi:hypothetical protein